MHPPLMTAAAAVLLGLSLAACGSNTPTSEMPITQAVPTPHLPWITGHPDYTALLRELNRAYPNAGWTLDLATQASQSICNDLLAYPFDQVVRHRTALQGGDRAQARGVVIASITHVCPNLKNKITDGRSAQGTTSA